MIINGTLPVLLYTVGITMESYIIDSFVMGCHVYKDIWSPKVNEELKTKN